MTRAIDRLVVCGVVGDRARPEGCWYDLVAGALKPVSVEEPADDGEGAVWRYRQTPPSAVTAATATGPGAMSPVAPPAWLARDVAIDAPTAETVSPSAAYDESVPARTQSASAGDERRKALARAIWSTACCNRCPTFQRPGAQRPSGGSSSGPIGGCSATRSLRTWPDRSAVCSTIRGSRRCLHPGAGPEIPIVGRIAREGRALLAVAGVVDRLAVTADAVLIADYKTNRPPPVRAEDVPPAYIRQLALYRAAIAQLYPGRLLRAALVWTEVPDLMEISPAAMDRELAALTWA